MVEDINYSDYACVRLHSGDISILVTRSVGPRILSLHFQGSDNLFAELPDFGLTRPDGTIFRLYGGHRLWHAPEDEMRTYIPDNEPVEVIPDQHGLTVVQPVEIETGIEKQLRISLVEDKSQIFVEHVLINRGHTPLKCAPWAITQLRTGGIAVLPQSQEQTGVLPNRTLALWPYTDLSRSQVTWGSRHILVEADMPSPFKVGFPNPRGWLAYWLDGILFVKRAAFDPQAEYFDFGSSSECYCNDRFLELETLAPISQLDVGESAVHTEVWELYTGFARPENEALAEKMIRAIGLE
ncbi:MAG: hypothetical protein ACK2UW_03495 [Anaerolineales bacterium]|jgi:hypothetical protein